MKIKLDENLPTELVGSLASLGHDVQTVPQEALTGRDDTAVLHAAVSEGRLLVTQDLHFSDLRQYQPGAHSGIVLLRLHHPSRRRITECMHRLLSMQLLDAWAGCLVVVTEHKFRVRRP
jgi:predicted nuclease of predicted toxin-antitoxin system